MQMSGEYKKSIIETPGIKKSDSFNTNRIKKIYVEKTNGSKKNGKKLLSITSVDYAQNNNLIKNRLGRFSKIITTSNKLQRESLNNKTEIVRLNSSPCFYDFLKKINTMRSNSSKKNIEYLITNEKNKKNKGSKFFNYLTTSQNSGIIKYHKKNTMSLSERVAKNNLF